MTNSERQEAFKILKNYRIEAQKECKGCLSISRGYRTRSPLSHKKWNYKGEECKFSYSGIPDIPNCACKECLIKCTCNNMCDDFVTQAKGYPKCINYLRDIKIDGPKKYRNIYETAK